MQDSLGSAQKSLLLFPKVLRSKLSPRQMKLFEFLANSSFMNVSNPGHYILRDMKDKENPASWEEIITVLGTEDAVNVNGQLKLVPVFLSLPSILQIRFLTFLSSVVSRISSHVMKSFLDKIRECHQDNLWLEVLSKQLQDAISVNSVELDNRSPHRRGRYKFSNASEGRLQDVLGQLGKKPLQVDVDDSRQAQNIECTKIVTLDVSKSHVLEDGTNGTASQSKCLSPNIVDVIVIDDDSDEDPIIVYDKDPSLTEDKGDRDITHKPVSNLTTSDDIQKQVLATNSLYVSEVLEGVGLENSNNNSVEPYACAVNTSQKRIASGDKDKHLKEESVGEELVRKKFKSDGNSDQSLHLEIGDSFLIHPEDRHLHTPTSPSALPENVQACLGSLRDACCSEEKEYRINADMLSCLLQLNESQMKEACVFLGPQHFTETALVSLCDNVPWSNLGCEATRIILESCFETKLVKLESSASQTMLSAVKSVAKIQPKEMIDVLAKVARSTQSGEYACQVLASVCKDLFPHDTFTHVIRQFCEEGITVNDHLVTVLQIVIDKGPDLDPDTLTGLLSLLSSGTQELASNAKFGKLLMGVVSKLGKKMSGSQLTTLCAIVDGHTSRLKRALQTTLKRVM